MAIIKPFKALRPKPEFAALVASKPYDVLSSAEARQEAGDNPYSFLHITKAEIDLPENVDIHSQRVYDKALDNLQIFQDAGILFQETAPAYYIYQLIMGQAQQTGLVCASAIRDYEQNVIKKHEFTRPDKELDRINHIKTTGAQTGNVFLAYRTNRRIHQWIEDWKSSHHPAYDFVASDGVKHMLWVVSEPADLERLTRAFAEEVPATYIADGHHRAASAAKVRSALGAGASPEADYFLTTLFPADQLHILDYNRLVKDLNGLSDDAFLQQLEQSFTLTEAGQAFSPGALHEFGMYLSGKWYKLVAKAGSYSQDPIGILDVSILQNQVLDKLLGITDPRTDKRIDFVGGIRGLSELEKRVDRADMRVAFSLFPVSIQQLFDIADSGEVMPPKSTWFEPKLRDGLLTHLIS